MILGLMTSRITSKIQSNKSTPTLQQHFRLFLLVDWDDVENRKCPAPIIPKITHDGDTRNFEQYSEPSWSKVILTEEELRLFDQF